MEMMVVGTGYSDAGLLFWLGMVHKKRVAPDVVAFTKHGRTGQLVIYSYNISHITQCNQSLENF